MLIKMLLCDVFVVLVTVAARHQLPRTSVRVTCAFINNDLTFWACSCHLRTRAAFALVQCVHVTSCHRRLCFAPIQAKNTAHVMQEQSVAKRTAAFAPSKVCFSAFCGEAVLVAAAMCTLAYICAQWLDPAIVMI
mmetsp:Transcript_66074/g.107195  ORF Transcript_66074/g.107195 Transcript_66074/m.107195 type:complete len:135 (-) Transcript_66074:70-474(-)